MQVYVPEFNSVIAFRVPRYHEVTHMRTNRPRYSVFGWFLQPGQLYELFQREPCEADVTEAQHKVPSGNQTITCKHVRELAQQEEVAVTAVTICREQHTVVSANVSSPHALSTLLSCKTLPDRQKRLSRLKTNQK